MPPKPVPIFSQPATIIPSRPNDQHDIATTLAFVDTLDTLPGELTKTFGDLRELDAVLNSTTTNITHKLRALTEALEGINRNTIPVKIDGIARNYDGNNPENAFPQADGTRCDIAPRDMDQPLERQPPYARPLDRFQLLLEIAEELTRYKIGVEDKVRVSGQACDTMIAQQAHLRALLANSSVLLASPLAISSDRSKMHGDTSHNRRQRVSPSRVGVDNTFTSGNGGSDQETLSHTTREHDLGYNAADVTPSKRRKTGKEKSASGMDFWDAEETSARLGSPALAKQPVAGTSATQLYKDKKNAPKRRR
ncbi:hypothetical protein QFC21_002099 [Naganishia friedmannii]|uniref:Uncharacterized protein n=1 Tax=Naganishia friedmannii TaxID=89922 RepID=A0ACC2VZR2_9TREE|nr:hypothetical protein QFC21_002099 [Naganishia friedmannii]